jgi:3-hydroxyacyl-[acyl-carrier-protein] dehydratase
MSNVNSVQIGVKYCGGCNPTIDRIRLVREIAELLPPGYQLSTDGTSTPWNIVILVCGCLVGCADKPELRNLAGRRIIVAGCSVDLEIMQEEKMAAAIVRKIVQSQE